ncbi:response regulator [Nitriliruptor alkaliphilus]|uniref:response regulator n=1 Tax=Nitriliruptor alkaliphilus TaxID=427918 RepID=UPI00069910FA|nr:response regulator transcription factor [Nitriliruptor alkaliphilus]
MKPYSVVVVDDYPGALGTVERVVSAVPDFEIVGEASSLVSLRDLALKMRARSETPDVVITDLELPDASGADSVIEIRHLWPSAGILVHTRAFNSSALRTAWAAGMNAYVLKEAEQLLSMLRLVVQGRSCMTEQLAAAFAAMGADYGLTPTQYEILCLVAQGYTNAEIAQIRRCAEKTVENHLTEVARELAPALDGMDGSNFRVKASRLAPRLHDPFRSAPT